MNQRAIAGYCAVMGCALMVATASFAQSTAFTYQGQLQVSGVPGNGSYDLEFNLYRAATTNSSPVGPSLTLAGTAVTNGLFTVNLDFGNGIFIGSNLWLAIGVRTHGSSGPFTTLNPLQPITPAPYALFAAGVSGLTIQQNADGAPDVVNGSPVNFVYAGVVGATIGGGGATNYDLGNGAAAYSNTVYGDFGTVSGGYNNTAGLGAVVGGGIGNMANGGFATVSGGFYNAVNFSGFGNFSGGTVGGGANNTNTANLGTIGGGDYNFNQSIFGTIGGGLSNVNNSAYCTVGGGVQNTNTGEFGTVGGGVENANGAFYATVGGGQQNIIGGFGTGATVSGGISNTASGYASTIPGGLGNTASGDYSFAAGAKAQASGHNAFVWSDGTATTFDNGADSVTFRANGGYKFYTGTGTAGAQLLTGQTAWSAISDRNAKKNIEPANCEEILDKLAQVPVAKWSYKWEDDTNTPNLGPMAQDFKAAFYPGRDDKSISTLEFDGVELAAIQGLDRKFKQLKSALDQREADNASLKRQNEALAKRLEQLEEAVKTLSAIKSSNP